MVSWVVKVFDETMNSVRAGSRPLNVSPMSAPSTLETKWVRNCGGAKGDRARAAMAGPRSDPPMPMLMTSVNVSPSAPQTRPSRTSAAKRGNFSRAPMTSGITSLPSTRTGLPEKLRKAVCRTARFSVALIFSPANMASRGFEFGAVASSKSAARRRRQAIFRIVEQEIVEGDAEKCA